MQDGVYIVNRQYDIEYVNPVLAKEFGPYHGRKCYEYFHDRQDVCPLCVSQEVFAGKTVCWEWHSSKKDKTYDLIDTPLTLQDGSMGKLEVFRDITARKRTEKEMERLRNFLKNMIDSMPSVLVGVDAEGRVTQWNSEAEKTTGVTAGEAEGRELKDVFPQFSYETTKVLQAIHERQVIKDEKIALSTDGETTYTDVTVYPLAATR